MKQIKLILLIALFFSSLKFKSQTGSSCSNAQLINHSSTYIDTNSISSSYWYKVKFNTLNASITTSLTSNNIHAIYVYSGNCSSLSLMKSDSIVNSNLLSLNLESIDTTAYYYIKISPSTNQIGSPYILALGSEIELIWVNPDGSTENCLNNYTYSCGMSICLGESLCFSFNYASSFTSGLPWDSFSFTGGYPNLLVPNTFSNPQPCAVFTPTSTGTFTVSGGLVTPFTIRVLGSAPTPSFAVSPSNPICLGSCVEFTSLNTPSSIISYSFNAVNTAMVGYPSNCLQYITTGNHLVEYILNAGHSCSTTATYTSIVVQPSVKLLNTIDPCNLTQSFIAVFNCNPNSAFPPTYTWNVFSGSTLIYTLPFSSSNVFNYTFPTTGDYYVEVAINVNGQNYNTGQNVLIGASSSLPSFVQSSSNCATICFQNKSRCNFSNITKWLWTATNASGFSQVYNTYDACFSFPSTGIYTVCLQQDNNPIGGTNPLLIGVTCQTVYVTVPQLSVITNTLLSLCNLPTNNLVSLNPNVDLGTNMAVWTAHNAISNASLTIPYTMGANGSITYNLSAYATYTAPIVFCVTICNYNQCVTIYPCCENKAGTVLYSNTTFSTNTNLSGPTPYRFSGLITVNSGVSLVIDVADVTFDPNTKLNIKGTLRIKGSYLHACSAMWDGIYLNYNSTCQLYQNTIEDAKRVVVDTLGAKIIGIETCWFNKNYESVILKSVNTTANLNVIKNVFTSNKIPNSAKTVPVQDWGITQTETSIGALLPTFLLPPYASRISYSGISLFQTKTPSNTSQYIQIDKYNLFNKLQFGIVAVRSRFMVQKNRFQNIIDIRGLYAGIYAYGNSSSVGPVSPILEASIGGTVLQANSFHNCTYGILNQYAGALTIRNNKFNLNSTAILITKNNKNKLVTIDRNKINESKVGISCFDNVIMNAQITENTLLNTTSVGAYNNNYGIFIGEILPPSPMIGSISINRYYNIYNNNITGYYNGIYVANTYSTQIVDNETHIRADNTFGNFQMGIRVEGTNKINIKNNMVDKPLADNNAWWQYGIFLDGNTIPAIKCNSINNFYASVKFQMLNYSAPGNGLTFNSFSNYNHAIWLDQNAEIGDQYFTYAGSNKASMNQWQTPPPPFGSQTFVSNNSNQTIASGMPGASKIFTSASGAYLLNNLFALTSSGNALLRGVGYSPLFIPCPASIPTPLMFRSNNIAVSNLSYGMNTTNLLHVSNRMLVKNLKTEGVNLNLPSNAIYKNFVNASYTNSVGQFYRVDSLLQLGISTGNISTISQAKLLNASISTPNLLEQNEKWLNATYIDMQTTEPDSTILLMLEQLAIKCPQYDGEAVYQARSLLMYYFGKSYNSICDMQNIQPSGSRTVNTATVQTEPTYVSASVYPNPTHKDITVTYTKGEGNEAAVFELYNMVGELVVNQTLTENKTTLSLSDLSNGIYIYIIKQDGVTLQTNKLVLSK